MITAEMKKLIEENTIGLVATVTPDGKPAVSPKATTVVIDARTIAFSDLRSPNTARNVRNNPAVEINYIDVFRRKACRIAGNATYIPKSDPRFAELARHFAKWDDLAERMRGFFLVSVEAAQLIRSPVYDSGRSEGDVRAQWKKYYAELD